MCTWLAYAEHRTSEERGSHLHLSDNGLRLRDETWPRDDVVEFHVFDELSGQFSERFGGQLDGVVEAIERHELHNVSLRSLQATPQKPIVRVQDVHFREIRIAYTNDHNGHRERRSVHDRVDGCIHICNLTIRNNE